MVLSEVIWLFFFFCGGEGWVFRLQWTVLTSISSVVLSIPLHSPFCQASLLWSLGHSLYHGMNPYLKTYRAEEADCDCEWCGKCHWPKRALGNCAGAHSDCQVGGAGEHGEEAPYWNCAAQIRPFQNLWHDRTMICSTSRDGVGARVLDEVMALR